MGRKSQSKPKKNGEKPTGSKFEIQKRKDLANLVDKLLWLTSVFQPTITPAKLWEHYFEIESLLKQISNLELPKVKPASKDREANLGQFLQWLSDNGAQFNGVEISAFEGYELGLKATKPFDEGSLLLTIPQKLMMTEENAKESELKEFITTDPLLQNMPNITLALFLLLEKQNAESFWKPYIDILPAQYTTILYFTSDELAELKPSPVLESSLKLYRHITRQYAYFWNKVHSSESPALKKLADIFTFENYRWAVSTVMTRQNRITLGEAAVTAFIPLWDMCNHREGKVTTEFNERLRQCECSAPAAFAAGDQLFIYYGLRSNADLFLHNGFVYPANAHDEYTLALGLSAGDAQRDGKRAVLRRLGLGAARHALRSGGDPLSAELLAFARVFCMGEEQLQHWLGLSMPSELLAADGGGAVPAHVDRRAYQFLRTRCQLLRGSYKLTGAVDGEGAHSRNIRLLKECEVKILDNAIQHLDSAIASLPADDK